MGLKDLIITPIFLLLIIGLATLYVRPRVNSNLQKFLLPGLVIKFIGAILLGVIYQYYYSGGDTFNYWDHGSFWIWKIFNEDITAGLRIIFLNDVPVEHSLDYNQIWLKRSSSGMVIVRMAALFDVLTLHTYTASSLFFALISFYGSWHLFETLSLKYPKNIISLFLVIFCFPSVVIWGSGIMKDSVVLGATLFVFSQTIRLTVYGRSIPRIASIMLAVFIISQIKIYILGALVPSIFCFYYFDNIRKYSRSRYSAIILPFLTLGTVFGGIFLTYLLMSFSDRYSWESLPNWVMVTAYDLAYWTGKSAGSTYNLGELDGTWATIWPKALAAINVSLFRPYLWESSNVLMLMNALESLILLLGTGNFLINHWRTIIKRFNDPIFSSFLLFVFVFAFAVGISTYNFGTLSRYRIPLLPLFGLIVFTYNKVKYRQTMAG